MYKKNGVYRLTIDGDVDIFSADCEDESDGVAGRRREVQTCPSIKPARVRPLFRPAVLLLAVFSSTMLGSCRLSTTYTNRNADKADAENIATRFYEAQRLVEFGPLESLYGNAYKDGSTREQRLNYLRAVTERLGTVKEITLEAWQSEVTTGSRADARYELVYQVIRSRRVSRDTLLLTKERDSIRIQAYLVSSDGMVIPGPSGARMPDVK